MNTKARIVSRWIALLVLISALAAPSLVFAGGWVVVTLDQAPGQVVAGQPYSLGMMARQHGQQPWQVDELRVVARLVGTNQEARFTAKPDQQPGHYQVDLLFPQPGRWEWDIQAGMFPDTQPMPALEVASGPALAGSALNKTPGNAAHPAAASRMFLGGFAFLAFAAGIVLLVRGQGRRGHLIAGVGAMLLCGGLVGFAFFSTVNAEASQALPPTGPSAGAATGQRLFLAKGCVVCHVNERAIQGSEEYSVSAGPNLTSYRNDPGYLEQFLKNPSSIKASTEMPNLELKAEEIDALVIFINDHPEE